MFDKSIFGWLTVYRGCYTDHGDSTCSNVFCLVASIFLPPPIGWPPIDQELVFFVQVGGPNPEFDGFWGGKPCLYLGVVYFEEIPRLGNSAMRTSTVIRSTSSEEYRITPSSKLFGGYTQLSRPLYHYIPGRLPRYPLSIDSKVMKPKAELWTCLVTLGKWIGWLMALGLPHGDINQQLLVYYPSSCNPLFTSQKLNPQLGDLFFPCATWGSRRTWAELHSLRLRKSQLTGQQRPQPQGIARLTVGWKLTKSFWMCHAHESL